MAGIPREPRSRGLGAAGGHWGPQYPPRTHRACCGPRKPPRPLGRARGGSRDEGWAAGSGSRVPHVLWGRHQPECHQGLGASLPVEAQKPGVERQAASRLGSVTSRPPAAVGTAQAEPAPGGRPRPRQLSPGPRGLRGRLLGEGTQLGTRRMGSLCCCRRPRAAMNTALSAHAPVATTWLLSGLGWPSSGGWGPVFPGLCAWAAGGGA